MTTHPFSNLGGDIPAANYHAAQFAALYETDRFMAEMAVAQGFAALGMCEYAANAIRNAHDAGMARMAGGV